EEQIERARHAVENKQHQQVTETIVRDQPKINRNDTVTIKNVMSGKSETMKFKKAETLLASGEWVVVNDSSSKNKYLIPDCKSSRGFFLPIRVESLPAFWGNPPHYTETLPTLWGNLPPYT